MSLFRSTVIAILLAPVAASAVPARGAHARKPAESEATAPQAQSQSPVQGEAQAPGQAAPAGTLLGEESGITQAPAGEGKPSERADAYYDFTMGHVYEQQFENTSKP